MSVNNQAGENQRDISCSCYGLKFLRIRVLDFFTSQPSSFCFILSLFFIAATFAILGLYIKGDHMPDLDAMKYWNAYVGRLGDRDFCFQQETEQDTLSENVLKNLHTMCSSTGGYKDDCPVLNKTVSYGVVGVELNFSVPNHALQDASMEGFHSSFTGNEVGAQVKENMNYTRIESCIRLEVWIQLLHINVTAACSNDECIVPGCLRIAAPTNAIPTRMPHVHKNFTFAAQVLESTGKPDECNCSQFSSNSLKFIEMKIIHDRKDCSKVNSTIVGISHSSKRAAKGYELINVELSNGDKLMASEHMYIAALAVAFLGCAFIVGIILSPSPSAKKISLA